MSSVQSAFGASASADLGEPWGEWLLPGKGEPAAGCGTFAPIGFCEEKGHVQWGARQYGRRDCPRCWSTRWAAGATLEAVSRLAAFRNAQPDGPARRLVHVTVSPPPGEAPLSVAEVFGADRTRAREIALDQGVRGGVMIPHGYRPTEAAKSACQGDRKIWAWIREQDDWREWVYWSPHYHVIGVVDPERRDPETGRRGHVDPATDRADGWVFKNIRSFERYHGPGDVEGVRDMVGGFRYLLSHATFPADEKRQVVTWFGAPHGRCFDPESVGLAAYRRIRSDVADLVNVDLDPETGEPVDDLDETCGHDGCGSSVVDLWAWPEYRRQREPGWSTERVEAAYRWATGRAKPPPGAKRPESAEAASEALGLIVERLNGGEPCAACGRWGCRGHL